MLIGNQTEGSRNWDYILSLTFGVNMEQAYQGSNKPSYWGTVGFLDHTYNYFEGG